MSFFRSLFTTSQQIKVSCLHILVVGHAGLALDPVLDDLLHVVVDRAALGSAGGGMLAPESTPFLRNKWPRNKRRRGPLTPESVGALTRQTLTLKCKRAFYSQRTL